jgi:hypothetical protein
MDKKKIEVGNIGMEYQEKIGECAIVNVHKVSPDGKSYAMIGLTFYGSGGGEAFINALGGIQKAEEEGWTPYRPDLTNKFVSDDPIDIEAAVNAEEIPYEEEERVPIDENGNPLKVFTVVGIEKYTNRSNNPWLRVHVAESSECKFGLTGNPAWKLSDKIKDWFDDKAELETVYKKVPESMKYVSAEKNQKGYWAYIGQFMESK